jgi:hypothetical protein
MKGTYADETLINKARDLYQTDDVEIDDLEVKTSVAEGGTWVAAWVWVPEEL